MYAEDIQYIVAINIVIICTARHCKSSSHFAKLWLLTDWKLVALPNFSTNRTELLY